MRATWLCLLLGACATTQAAQTDEHALGLRLADATLGAGAPASALHVADGLLRTDPSDEPALLRRGRALLALQRGAEAAQSFADAQRLSPADADAGGGLARARAQTGDAAGAEAAWRAVLAHHPRDVTAGAGLAVSLDLQERHAEAQTLYRDLLARRPDDAALRTDLGLSLALSGDLTQGLPLLQQAAGGSARARHNLAVGLVLAGDTGGAEAVLAPELGAPAAQRAVDGVRLLARR